MGLSVVRVWIRKIALSNSANRHNFFENQVHTMELVYVHDHNDFFQRDAWFQQK